MKHLFVIAFAWLSFVVLPDPTHAEVIISEFMADNDRVLLDEDGQSADWIELNNTGPTPVNLAGYFLTDDALTLTKWALPSVTLSPGGYLVVFASGKNRTNDPAHLHTSFQLNAGGGFLALVKPDGTSIASAYTYPSVKEDVSFGLAQNVVTTALLANSVSRILVPTNAAQLPVNWNALAFVPGAEWSNGAAPRPWLRHESSRRSAGQRGHERTAAQAQPSNPSLPISPSTTIWPTSPTPRELTLRRSGR
jgi:hypothetical protein